VSTAVANSLIEKLKEKQTKERLSDYGFADKLSVSHQLWQMTRTGKREIGLAVLQGTIRAYPELDRDVLIFLGGDVDMSPKDEVDNHNTPEKPCNQNLDGLRHKLISFIQSIVRQ